MRTRCARALPGLGFLSLVLVAAGCGRDPLTYNDKVEGTVTLDGVALANVRVEFIPDGVGSKAPSSSAFTDAQGRYELTYGEQKTGAVVGRHRVVVFAGRQGAAEQDEREAQPARGATPALPQLYAIAAQTPLRVEITSEQHTYDLKLTRKAAPLR